MYVCVGGGGRVNLPAVVCDKHLIICTNKSIP